MTFRRLKSEELLLSYSSKREKTTWSMPVERIERVYMLLKNLSDTEIAKLVEIARQSNTC